MGERNFALIEFSNNIGIKPTNVVTEVSKMGRNRVVPASTRAAKAPTPSRRNRLT